MSFFCCKNTLIFLYESNYFTKKLLICVQNAYFCSMLQVFIAICELKRVFYAAGLALFYWLSRNIRR